MQGWVRVLPLIVAALVAAAPLAREAPWKLRDVVDFYNQGTRTAYLYRVVGAGASDARATPGQIQFMVKETECLKSEVKNIEDCNFQDGGAMKDCTALLPVDPETDAIVIHCGSPVPKGTRLVRRPPWRCGRRPGCFGSIAEGPKQDLEHEDFPIATENRSPGAEIHTKRGTRLVCGAPRRCGRRPGCFSGIGKVEEAPEEVEFSSDLVTEDFQVNTPAEEIHETFHETDLDNEEDLPIATESRSPGAEIHKQRRARVRRARPWDCYRRGGCYSSIGHGRPDENLPQEPGWIRSPEQDSGVLGSYDSDLDEKEIPRGLKMLLGNAMKSKESRKTYEVEWTWDDQDTR